MYLASRIIYTLFTILIPGSGLGVINSKRIIFIIFGIWILLFVLMIQSRLITSPIGFCVFLFSILALYLASIAIGFYHINRINIVRAYTYLTSIICSVFFVASIVFILVFKEQLLGINLFFVPSASMEPTLIPGDVVVVDTWKYHDALPAARDVVVFYTRKTKITYIKRVKSVSSPYFNAEGDNPRHSIASENLRNQPISNLRGKAVFVLFNLQDKNVNLARSFISL